MRAYLARVLQRCTPLFAASGASIFLRQSSGVYQLETQFGISPPIPLEAKIEAGKGVAGACLELRKPLLVKDVRSESQLSGRQIKPREELGSAMVVPLIIPDGTVIGVINLSRHAGDPDFGEKDLKRAESLAYQVALAVGSGQLLASAEQNHAWLKELMQYVPAAVLALSPDGQIQEANEAGRRLLESPPAWLTHDLQVGRTKLTDPETRRIWRVDCHKAGKGTVVIAED